MLEAVLIDPARREVSSCALPEDVQMDARSRWLFGFPAASEGCRVQDLVSCGHICNSDESISNAYKQWREEDGYWVLTVGDKEPDDRLAFRLGPPAGRVKATVYWGKGVLVRYSRCARSEHVSPASSLSRS